VSWNMPGFARIKTAFRGLPVERFDPSKTLPSVAPRPLSKGPPPLPKMPVPAFPEGDVIRTAEILFEEGVDGHAESVPPSGPYAFPLGGDVVVTTEAHTTPADEPVTRSPSLSDEWMMVEEAPSEEEVEVEVEDPVRTRRRRAARIGTAWGTAIAVAAAGVALFVTPRRDVRADAADSVAVETSVEQAPAATQVLAIAPSPKLQPSPVAATALPPAVHATTASAVATTPASRGAVARDASRSTPALKPRPASAQASSTHAPRARHSQPTHAAPPSRGSTSTSTRSHARVS
jgi:hypothetical protein